MNLSKLVLIAALAGAAGISTMAHADRVHVILGVGGPLGPSYAPAYYGGGFGYMPPAGPYPSYVPYVAVPVSPPVYVERQSVASSGSWYFCRKARAYYPYVQSCSSGWEVVPAQPVAGN
jgi:hypothetical protein